MNEHQAHNGLSPIPPHIYLDPEKAATAHRKRVYRHHVFEIPIMRASSMFMIAVFVLLYDLHVAPSASAWPDFLRLLGIFAAYSGVSWLVLLLFFKRLERFHLGLFFLFSDLLLFLPAIYYTGGEKSWFFFLFMVRTADQTRTTWKKTILFAHISTLCYIALLVYLAFCEHRPISVGSALTITGMIYAANIYLSLISRTAERLRSRMTEAIRVSRDLIRQMEAQSDELKTSESEYRKLIEGSIQGICIHRDGSIKLANTALARIFGYEGPGDMVGRHYLTLVDERDKERIEGYQKAVQEGRTFPESSEFIGIRKDGTPACIECMVSSIMWHGSAAVLATIQDVTARRKAEEELQRAHDRLEQQVQARTEALQKSNAALVEEIAERRRAESAKNLLDEQLRQSQKMEAIGQLAGGIAHDFNNLLTIILGYSQMIGLTCDDGFPFTKPLSEIHNAALRAKNLTGQLLAFGRKQMLAMQVVDINRVITGFEQLLRRSIGEDIQMEIVLCPEPALVKADIPQLEQILMNLVVNARDAMPDGGILRIKTDCVDAPPEIRRAGAPAGRSIAISVSDSGVGMERETLEKIFEPFYTTKAIGRGTGLGLSTVYGAVKQHDGNISVTSEPGHGTVFEITLPAVDRKIGEDETVLRRAAAPNVAGTTVLVVEDEPSVRKMACDILGREGYRVIEAADVFDAIEKARTAEEPIRLLLTDVIMPQLTGIEVCEMVRDFQPGIKTLYMSGHTDSVIARHGGLNPGIHFLQKPFSAETLLQKAAEALAG